MISKPKAYTHRSPKTMAHFTAPHNRVKNVSTIPHGGHSVTSGTTIPKLGKKMSVADILHMRYPK